MTSEGEKAVLTKSAVKRALDFLRSPGPYPDLEPYVQMSEETLYFFIKNFPERVYCENGRVYIGGLLGYRYFRYKPGDPIYYTEEDYERIKSGGYE